jgi:hypothetical protein
LGPIAQHPAREPHLESHGTLASMPYCSHGVLFSYFVMHCL